jgi:hypothetical protein
LFIAGVINWVGSQPPTQAELFGRSVVRFAFAHLKAIAESGGQILGSTALHLGDIPTEAETLSLSVWGFGVPKIFAQTIGENG